MTPLVQDLPANWRAALGDSLSAPYLAELATFLDAERQQHTVFPPAEEVFAAFEHVAFPDVRVVLLGQDPYHGDGQAHGLCFSVRRGVKLPPSLRNVYKELGTDLDLPTPEHGCLEAWAQQGVLMLNTVLTVRAHSANSHRKKGWEQLTDRVIEVLAAREDPLVFILWGKPAQTKIPLIEAGSSAHVVLCAAHPSPFSARNGFFGSKPFSGSNEALAEMGRPAVDWSLPD